MHICMDERAPAFGFALKVFEIWGNRMAAPTSQNRSVLGTTACSKCVLPNSLMVSEAFGCARIFTKNTQTDS